MQHPASEGCQCLVSNCLSQGSHRTHKAAPSALRTKEWGAGHRGEKQKERKNSISHRLHTLRAEDKLHTISCSCLPPTVTSSMPLSLVSDQAAKQLPMAL